MTDHADLIARLGWPDLATRERASWEAADAIQELAAEVERLTKELAECKAKNGE